jgi:hypothetical protein
VMVMLSVSGQQLKLNQNQCTLYKLSLLSDIMSDNRLSSLALITVQRELSDQLMQNKIHPV